MSWDELCCVCGVCPGGGPYSLLDRHETQEQARKIAAEIKEGDEQLVKIVHDALDASFSPKEKQLGFRHDWLPKGMGSTSGEALHYSTGRQVVVGYFEKGQGWVPAVGPKIPSGEHIQVRQVCGYNGGDFTTMVCTYGPWDEREIPAMSYCSIKDNTIANTPVCERCYYFLRSWIDWSSLPPASDGRSLSFPGELYELVNSREKERDAQTGLLPLIDYDGIESSLDQWQSRFIPCRRGIKHLSGAIAAGLRGKELIPALLQDCRAWMFMRPDIWPTPQSASDHFTFSPVHSPTAPPPALCNMPNEILLPILYDLPIYDLLSLSTACRSLHRLIMDPPFLNRVLQEAILRGSFRYVLPVHQLRDEEERAYEAVRLWLPAAIRPARVDEDQDRESGEDDGIETEENPEELERVIPPVKPMILDPQFPALAFVRACASSDSMRNRRRLWGMVKQFEKLWRKYRLKGWEVDRFFPSADILDRIENDPIECKPACER